VSGMSQAVKVALGLVQPREKLPKPTQNIGKMVPAKSVYQQVYESHAGPARLTPATCARMIF